MVDGEIVDIIDIIEWDTKHIRVYKTKILKILFRMKDTDNPYIEYLETHIKDLNDIINSR